LAAPDNPNAEKSQTGFRPEIPPLPPDQRTGFQPPASADLLKQRHAEMAGKLSKWLVIILTIGIVLHYGCLMALILLKRDDGAKVLEDVFHSWLPVVSGLAGGAATYYFTKNER